MVINKLTKKLEWPKYHQWYSTNSQIRSKTGNYPVLLSLDGSNNDAVQISNTAINNITVSIYSLRNVLLMTIKGTIDDINKSFVHLNHKTAFDKYIPNVAIKQLCKILWNNRMITESNMRLKLSKIKIKNIPIEQYINDDLIAKAKTITTALTKLIGTSNTYNKSISFDDERCDFAIVDKSMLSNVSDGLTFNKLSKLSKDKCFDSDILQDVFDTVSFENKSVIPIKFDKLCKYKSIQFTNCNRSIWLTKTSLINIQTINISNSFKTFSFTTNNGLALNLTNDGSSIDLNVVSKGKSVTVSNTRLKPFLTRFASKMSIPSYDDHLSDLKADLTQINACSETNFQLNGIISTIDKLVDNYSDLDDNTKAAVFDHIQSIKAFVSALQYYGTDLLVRYLTIDTNPKLPFLLIK